MVDGGISSAYVTPGVTGARAASATKRSRNAPAELVPGLQPRHGLAPQRLGVEPDAHGVLVALVGVEPPVHVRARDLGVELDAPDARARQAVGLHADRARGQDHGALGRPRLVAVPVEGLEALGQVPEQRVGASLGGQLDVHPADLRLAGAPGRAARGLRHELGAKADAERRHAATEELGEELLLAAQPRVRRPPGRRASRRRTRARRPRPSRSGEPPATGTHSSSSAPAARTALAEDAGARVALVDDREDPHRGQATAELGTSGPAGAAGAAGPASAASPCRRTQLEVHDGGGERRERGDQHVGHEVGERVVTTASRRSRRRSRPPRC